MARHPIQNLPTTPGQLRQDRILEEALATGADPLHLTAMFGFTAEGAIRSPESSPPNSPFEPPDQPRVRPEIPSEIMNPRPSWSENILNEPPLSVTVERWPRPPSATADARPIPKTSPRSGSGFANSASVRIGSTSTKG